MHKESLNSMSNFNTRVDRPRVALLGIPVDQLDTAAVLDCIFALASRPHAGSPRMIATLNVDFIVNALKLWHHRCIPGLLDVLRSAALVTPDGMPLILLSRLLGAPLPERVTGADLVPQIAERAAVTGTRLYFLGGAADVTNYAAELLTQRYPNLCIVGVDTSLVKLDESMATSVQNADICARINAARPDLLLVALGNPKQELWLARHMAMLRVPVAMGVGGTFNFISGKVSRAPRWVQVVGLEFVYRIIQEPKRLWKRYLLGLIVFNVLSVLALAGFALWVLLRPFSRSDGIVREFTGTVVLDCRGVLFANNPFRIHFLDAKLYANQNGLAFKTVNVAWLLRLQMEAHRLN